MAQPIQCIRIQRLDGGRVDDLHGKPVFLQLFSNGDRRTDHAADREYRGVFPSKQRFPFAKFERTSTGAPDLARSAFFG